MRRLCVLLFVAALLWQGALKAAEADKPAASPEDVVRAFFLAMLSKDKAALEKAILAHPNAEVLCEREPMPAEELAKFKAQARAMTCRECKVGDTFAFPGGAELKVTAAMLSKDRKLLVLVIGGQSMPMPLPVCRVNGEWKVDAASVIAARLAAREAGLVTYRDAQGRFTLRHPRGWTATANAAGVLMLKKGQIGGLVMVNAGVAPQMTGSALLDALVGPLKNQFKDFREVRRGPRALSGQQAVEAVITGTDPRLGAQRGHITALVAAGTSYVLMMSGPEADVKALEREWEAILGSFKLGQAGGAAQTTGPAGPVARIEPTSPVGAWRFYGERAGSSWTVWDINDGSRVGGAGVGGHKELTLLIRPDGTWAKLQFEEFFMFGPGVGSLEKVDYNVQGRGAWRLHGNRLTLTKADGSVNAGEFKVHVIKDGRQLLIRQGKGVAVWGSANFFQDASGLSFWLPAEWQVQVQQGGLRLIPPKTDLKREIYVLGVAPLPAAGVRDPADPRIVAQLDQGVRKQFPNHKLKGKPSYFDTSIGKGAILTWEIDFDVWHARASQKGILGSWNTSVYAAIAHGQLITLHASRWDDGPRFQALNQIFMSLWLRRPGAKPAPRVQPKPGDRPDRGGDDLGGF